jgi:DNA-binding transcriptional LysR family regulator
MWTRAGDDTVPSEISLSTDQVAAFIEVARHGSLRAAARALFITEQGVRNRLVALEAELGVELYRKARGIRRGDVLTPAGRRLLPRATNWVEQAAGLAELFQEADAVREVHVASSQYLSTYVLIDAIRRFHQVEPGIRVWLSVRTERDIEQVLARNPEISLGVAAPNERTPELAYEHLFSMEWSVVLPKGHRLSRRGRLALVDLAEEPLILFERDSTGREHVLEAFAAAGVAPRVEMEATTTDLVVRMTAAGLGVAVVPLLPSGVVTRGHDVVVRALTDPVRPIDSGILYRRGETLSAHAKRFVEFVVREVAASRLRAEGRRRSRRPARQ